MLYIFLCKVIDFILSVRTTCIIAEIKNNILFVN